ncbi:inner membrane protein YpjD [Thalassospira sp. MCCC 1A03138]|uniref:cytochrome C assembly family protein n=1 Tax=Thalassospira sp. MCCC 1A03138 TaxID=1470576 RepID=UPI000A1D86DA|nr:cytochrome c biogenesis protein CcsA [Thalassospira sp. MCCC 1A03138]OSQ30957.1 cytochrome C biogenesis protein [Thalassospira sp. MCCC 1A03138]
MIAAALHILCLLPLTTQIMRRDPQRDIWLFLSIFVAAAGTVIVLGLTGEEVQSRGFTAALHWSELSVILIFGGLVICNGPKQIWRLAGYIGGYLLAFGGVAAVFNVFEPVADASVTEPVLYSGWLWVHIGTSLVTYALVTLSAIAAMGYVVQEDALKNRRPNRWSRRLPPLRDSEYMLVSFLKWSAWVLVIGIITGFALRQIEGQSLLYLDHKMLLTLLGFAVICGLIFIHEKSTLRGRMAVRFVLGAWLLLTLAFPGVRFVSGYLIG